MLCLAFGKPIFTITVYVGFHQNSLVYFVGNRLSESLHTVVASDILDIFIEPYKRHPLGCLAFSTSGEITYTIIRRNKLVTILSW